MMPRPSQIPARAPLSASEIDAACYKGSKEHKAKRWWGGLPGARVGKDGKAKRPKKLRTSICWLVAETAGSGMVAYAAVPASANSAIEEDVAAFPRMSRPKLWTCEAQQMPVRVELAMADRITLCRAAEHRQHGGRGGNIADRDGAES